MVWERVSVGDEEKDASFATMSGAPLIVTIIA